MATYDYILQGVPLTDNRWGSALVPGVWHLLQDTSVLPKFPGLQVTRFTRPNQHGESQAQYAPLQPKTLEFNLRFMAICSDPSHPRFMREGSDFDERMAFLEENINDFFFRVQLGSTSTKGYLELKRVNNQFEHFPPSSAGSAYRTTGTQTTAGRFLSSSEAQMDRDARYADYTLLFETPSGTWWTERVEVRRNDLSAGTVHTFELPMGTAPVWDTLIAVRPRGGDTRMNGTRFRNDMQMGFQLRQNTFGSQWTILNPDTRGAGRSAGSSPNWDAELNSFNEILELGRPQGSALVINPGIAGDGRRLGYVDVRLNEPGDVAFYHSPRFF